jgi:hypothetical protein
MKTLSRISLLFALAVGAVFGQTALTQTTLSVAALATDGTLTVASATGINAPAVNTPASELYVIAPGATRGEAMLVQGVSSTTISAARGRGGIRSAFPSGSRVLIGNPNYFASFDPSGGCTAASTAYTPVINTKTGLEWLCSTITNSWVPGWGNTTAPAGVTTVVASAAGSVVPSGPLFHVTGTSAITGFTVASMIGFANAGCFTIIPDAIFTWTAAGNIALAGTAVVNKALTFCWEQTNSKWVPSYIA